MQHCKTSCGISSKNTS